jgi:putative endonuclease
MYYVYIVSNWMNTVIYIGVTNNLERRLSEHRRKVNKGFTSKYHINKLVYYDSTNDIRAAIAREKQLKRWSRKKKTTLIESINPQWEDLSKSW